MGKCLIATGMARKEGIIEPEGGEEEQGFRYNRITKCGYAQQEISSYATRAVTVRFDRGKHIYTVPQHFVKKVPAFAVLLSESRNYSISLFEADEDVGHIMVCYL
ncbi:uncharacterized protein ASPGLDRAFT_22266 [Aspergillus glaucus CBS 516.65]|uniref:Uncharacterized protein n=1 Tax=Aspergillus glaucus CBS 516.65 TaxID=1160497 RepID=A0A1L9VY20_ASPGL|nr:hypothetical protein ASPGLDRAFT_22266 [Aspergillus glaucus CBS 516.65]OJJ88795.1 hypothetical protein ASPGLDRAFT_22266 [Aspergillus glaucus CBS 516.65]